MTCLAFAQHMLELSERVLTLQLVSLAFLGLALLLWALNRRLDRRPTACELRRYHVSRWVPLLSEHNRRNRFDVHRAMVAIITTASHERLIRRQYGRLKVAP